MKLDAAKLRMAKLSEGGGARVTVYRSLLTKFMKEDSQKGKLRKFFLEIRNDMPGINLVYLFGSQVEGNTGPMSDFDHGVFLERNQDGPQIRFRLSIELAQIIRDERMDVVLLNRVPIELAYAVIADGEILYQKDDATRVDYEARVMGLYFDYLKEKIEK